MYCGCKRYSDFREKLGEEHVIPLALNGDLIVPLAACYECETKINKYEQPIRSLFGFSPASTHQRIALLWLRSPFPVASNRLPVSQQIGDGGTIGALGHVVCGIPFGIVTKRRSERVQSLVKTSGQHLDNVVLIGRGQKE